MKQQILLMAQLLMARNVKVSNLEIKNSLHGAFSNDPTFSLRQNEVSPIMHELYVEQNWARVMNTTAVPGTPFYEYSLQPTVALQPAVPASAPVQSASQTPASPTSATTSATTPAPATHTGIKLDPANGNIVCYVRQNPSKLVQGTDRSSARKACFAQFNDNTFGLVYDNINTCSVDYYNRHKV